MAIDLTGKSSKEIYQYQKTIPTSYGEYLARHPGASYRDWAASPECDEAGIVQAAYDVAVRAERPDIVRDEAEARHNNETWAKSAPRPAISPRQIGYHHGPSCTCPDCDPR